MKQSGRVTIRKVGTLFFLYNRDVSMRQCWNDERVAKAVAERMNKAVQPIFQRVA